MNIPISKYIGIPFVLFLLLLSCTEEEEVLQNEELIFSDSYQIKIPGYQYYDNEGNLFQVRGDTSYQAAYPDTLNNKPSFAWDSIGLKIIKKEEIEQLMQLCKEIPFICWLLKFMQKVARD